MFVCFFFYLKVHCNEVLAIFTSSGVSHGKGASNRYKKECSIILSELLCEHLIYRKCFDFFSSASNVICDPSLNPDDVLIDKEACSSALGKTH